MAQAIHRDIDDRVDDDRAPAGEEQTCFEITEKQFEEAKRDPRVRRFIEDAKAYWKTARRRPSAG